MIQEQSQIFILWFENYICYVSFLYIINRTIGFNKSLHFFSFNSIHEYIYIYIYIYIYNWVQGKKLVVNNWI